MSVLFLSRKSRLIIQKSSLSISMSIEVANWRVLEIASDHQLYINLKNMHVHIVYYSENTLCQQRNIMGFRLWSWIFFFPLVHFILFSWIFFFHEFISFLLSIEDLDVFFFLSYPIYHVLFSWCFWKFTICYDAKCAGYVHVGTCRISPNHKYIAYTLDLSGSEVFVLQVKDLRTGRIISNSGAEGVVSLAWTSDSNCLLYTVCDESLRPYRYFCVLFK